MPLLKISRDFLRKLLLDGGDVVPRELLDLHEYFRLNGPIPVSYTHLSDDYSLVGRRKSGKFSLC